MDKFSQLENFEKKKFADKTKNAIYSMIKDNVNLVLNGGDNNVDVSLDGLEELTNVLYNFVQDEKKKQEVVTLERVKLDAALGHFNVKLINEHIENLKK